MTIPNKTLKNGFTMPVFGLGTWQMGGGMERNHDNDDAKDVDAIRTAIQLGISHIDTAEVYADGHAEELVARAIEGVDRSKLFLVSKVYRTHLEPKDMLHAVTSSLSRLQAEYLDLYLIHSPSQEIPLQRSIPALNALVDEGLVHSIGVSNFSKETLQKAQNLSHHPIVCNQVHYNLIYREPQRTSLLTYCQQNDIMLCAWRPIQKGELARKGTYPLLDQMADTYHKTPAQMAINWLISQENVVTIAKSSTTPHLQENLGALGWNLHPKDRAQLNDEFPHQEDVSDIVKLR